MLLDPNDLIIDVYAWGVPGKATCFSGPYANCSVHVKHIPTGISQTSLSEPTVLGNKERAIELLAARVEKYYEENKDT
jgi:protein subunit release factor A